MVPQQDSEYNYIRVDYCYEKTKGLLKLSEIKEFEHVFLEKNLPFRIEAIINGFIIFFKDLI